MNGWWNKYIAFLIVSIFCTCCTLNFPYRALYVNNKTGNDKFPGTIRKPIKSIPETNARLKENPCNVLFAGGQVFDGPLQLSGINGTDSIPIIISTYGDSAKAIINGGVQEAIIAEKSRFLRIENLDLRGDGRKEGNTANGLRLIGCRDFILENIRAEGFQKSGVDLYNCRNTSVLKVFAYNNGFSGINVMGSARDSSGNIIIKDCRAENNPGDPTKLDNHSGNGILVGVSDSVLIDHCTATNNGWDMPRQGNGPVGIWAWESSHMTIQYCISYRNKTSKGGKDGGGFDLDGGVRSSLIQYCLSYENQGAGYGLFQYSGASGWSDNIIRYCVSINDANTTEGAGSFFIWNGSRESGQLRNCYIYNNVAYNTFAPIISFENNSNHENFNFSNNIFIGPADYISEKNTGSRFAGNFRKDAESLKEWADSAAREKYIGFPQISKIFAYHDLNLIDLP